VASSARVDRFLANSRFVAERIRRYYRRSAEVLAPPVDTEFFTPTQGEGAPSEGAGGGASGREAQPYCLAVAALAPYKRLELAFEACRKLGLALYVVGTGPESARLRRLAGGEARLLGRVDRERLRDLYRDALCLLQPGIEDFGIAPVEALACGTPVVALGRGGVLDVVEDGVHGVLYPEPSAEALAAAIDRRRQIRFNTMDLHARAQSFSTMSFLARFRSLLEAREAV
jgi:glycosyltransferase involved in cell wall biosynthesis